MSDSGAFGAETGSVESSLRVASFRGVMGFTNPLFLMAFTVLGNREVPRIGICRDIIEVLKRLPLLSQSGKGQLGFRRLGHEEGVRLYRTPLSFLRE